MFSVNRRRFFTTGVQLLERFKVFPSENVLRHRALVDSIAESNDQTAFFAWHPKKDFPYEFTREVPKNMVQKNSSLLKDEMIATAQINWKQKSAIFTREKLAKATFTCVHRWYPRARNKKHNYKQTPMDRKYL